jgi:anti-sigma B factor antagonist
MQIAEREVGAVTVLDLSGRITLGEGDTLLKDKLHSLLHQGKKNLLLNLGQVSYVDSAGLGALVATYITVNREGGTLKLVGLTKKLQDLLSITKLLTVFETFDTEDEAIRSFR